MDPMTIFALALRYGVAYAPIIKDAIDEAISNDDLATKLSKLAGPLAPLLTTLGATVFPKAKPALQIAAAATAAFNPSITKWIQGTLNVLDPTVMLVVDGLYGPKTRAAVEAFQTAHGLAVVDGWVGQLTEAALQLAANK